MTVISWLWRKLGRVRWFLLWLFSPKYMVGTNAVIMNAQGQVWLQQHRFWAKQAWGLPGGIIKSNEQPEVALAREIFEETGLECVVGRALKTELFFRRGITIFYTATLLPGTLHLDYKEILAADYFSLDNLPSNLLPSHAKFLQEMRKVGGFTVGQVG